MMRKATRVVSFGSTTGLEATYWGKPSILGYRSYFDRLGSVHIPKSHDEMMRLIVGDDTPPADKPARLMYGYFMKTFGMPFRYNRPTGLTGGTFKSGHLKPHVAVRTAGWLLERPAVRDVTRRLHLRIVDRRMLGDDRCARRRVQTRSQVFAAGLTGSSGAPGAAIARLQSRSRQSPPRAARRAGTPAIHRVGQRRRA